jgi:undecaprenyl pyrophosphate phosphatase UppP
MKTCLATCLQGLLPLALGIVIVPVWLVALVPMSIGLLVAAVVLRALFSPLLIPVAMILGTIWLVKKMPSARHRPAARA